MCILKKIINLFFLIFFAGFIPVNAQSLKEKARDAFMDERYSLAIDYLKQAIVQQPEDAELYYYLGFFSHYLVYDSRPFIAQGDDWSRLQVLENLEKAISLKPDYGDAYYFIGAEYGARALESFMAGHYEQYKIEYQLGHQKGGYPAWMLELANNMLNSVEKDGILFVQGDAEYNSLKYLQVVENKRPDVSVIPLALLERPWFVRMYRNGVSGYEKAVPISFTDRQIDELRPYKWSDQFISIPIPAQLNKKYQIDSQVDTLFWYLEADLFSESKRPLLSAKKAVFANILETNAWQRPLYISMGAGSIGALDKFRQIHGCVYKLLPFDTDKHALKLDVESIEKLFFNASNFKNFPSVATSDMPRVSFMLLNYHSVLLELAHYYYAQEKYRKSLEIIDQVGKLFPGSVFPMPDYWVEYFGKFRASVLEKIDEQKTKKP